MRACRAPGPAKTGPERSGHPGVPGVSRQGWRHSVQFAEQCRHAGTVRISERIEADRRQQHLLARVARGTWRLDQAERERGWALASAHAEGISIRTPGHAGRAVSVTGPPA